MTNPSPTCPRPDLVIRTDDQGRFWVACLTCREASAPSAHRPKIEQWKREHVRKYA